jgi:hypothetical protein
LFKPGNKLSKYLTGVLIDVAADDMQIVCIRVFVKTNRDCHPQCSSIHNINETRTKNRSEFFTANKACPEVTTERKSKGASTPALDNGQQKNGGSYIRFLKYKR